MKKTLSRVFTGLVAVTLVAVSGLSAQAADSFKVGIATPATGFTGIFIAQDKGLFKQQGLDVELVMFQSGAAAAQALAAGAVNVVAGDVFPVFDSWLGGRDAVTVWAVSNVPAYVWYAAPKFNNIKDVKGGKVGISAVASMSYYLSIWMLDQNGLNGKSDVTYVPLGGPLARAAGLQAGQVDLIPASAPGSFDLERSGFKPLLKESDPLPEASDEVLYIRKSNIDKDDALLKKFLAGLVHGIRSAKQDPDEATKIVLKNLGGKDSDFADYRRAIDINNKFLPEDGHFPEKAFDVYLGFYKDQGKIKEIPDHKVFADYRFIEYFKQNPIK